MAALLSERAAGLSLVKKWNHYYRSSVTSANSRESAPEKQLIIYDMWHTTSLGRENETVLHKAEWKRSKAAGATCMTSPFHVWFILKEIQALDH